MYGVCKINAWKPTELRKRLKIAFDSRDQEYENEARLPFVKLYPCTPQIKQARIHDSAARQSCSATASVAYAN